MKAFFTAFRAYTKTGQLYSDLGGRLYSKEVPQGTGFPYGLWTFPYGGAEYDLDFKSIESISAQLDIYSETDSELLDLFKSANTDFNNCSFDITGYELIEFKRVTQRMIQEDGISRYIIEFSITIGEE